MTDLTRKLLRDTKLMITVHEFNEATTTSKFVSDIRILLENNAAYADGDSCPACGDRMAFDRGEPVTRQEPEEMPAIICSECGEEHPVDWDREEMKEFSEPEFIDPKDDGQLTLAERNR